MTRVQQLRHLSPVAVDRLVAVAVLVLCELSVALQDTSHPGVGYAAGVLLAVATLFRRSHPLAALTFALAVFLTDVLVGGHAGSDSATLLALLVMTYSLGRHADPRRVAAGAVVMVPTFVANGLHATDGFVNELAFGLLVVCVLPIVAGVTLRRRAALVSELRVQRGELERERDARVRDAAIAERVRIARELHDVVVHDVSEMVVQAAAAREIVRAQPQVAAEAIAKVEGAGRGALDELRRALGVLRADDRAMALEPQPSLAGLRALIDRTAGRVELELEVTPDELPGDLQLTVYRLVEDVLADGTGHAGHGTVRVSRDTEAITVEVAHAGPPPSPASLGAMRQRVEIFAGELDISTDPGTGLRVCARLSLPISVTG
jgi:signal transduction histidine kinase